MGDPTLENIDLLRRLGRDFEDVLKARGLSDLDDCGPVQRMGLWQDFIRQHVPDAKFREFFPSEAGL